MSAAPWAALATLTVVVAFYLLGTGWTPARILIALNLATLTYWVVTAIERRP